MTSAVKMKNKSWEDISLWKHQKEAVDMVVRYLESHDKRSALVRMPTGTGKSGVIAVIARCFRDFSNVLVVVPWADLLEQLKRDIENRFWQKINEDPNQWPKKVKHIKPSTALDLINNTKNTDTIFICTVQTLQIIYSEKQKIYKLLKKRISIVMVDEGHREPAPEWSKAVRELEKPTILFTATPYRNDHKMFNVNPKYVFAYSHQKALRDKYIREVLFHEEEFNDSAEVFVQKILDFYNSNLYKTSLPDVKQPRVIVRCKTNNDVNDIANRLKNLGKKVIAVHDRFSNSKEDFCHKRVPNPEETDAIFWVHQYKLIEGIDDPRFAMLAIYQPFNNARELVQQIGRVIRNPKRKANQKAFVFTDPTHRQCIFWEGYRKYEERYESNPELYESRQIFDTIIKFQPEYQYFEGNYRSRLNIESADLYKHYYYPSATNAYEIRKGFSVEELRDEIEKEWFKYDIDIRKIEHPDAQTYIFTYATYNNSPILVDQALFEYKIGFTIFRKKEQLIFFYDSQGRLPEYLIKSTEKVDPNVLQRLFKGRNVRLSEISLMNMDLGLHSIRRRTLHARSIEDTAPNLTDYAYFISTARGFTESEKKKQTNRYIGFTKSRISDYSSRYNYEAYIKWLDLLASSLTNRYAKRETLFNRFASFTKPPNDTTPINILLDLDDVLNSFETATTREKISFDDACYEIQNGEFTCILNSKKYKVSVIFDLYKKLYKLSSSELEKTYVRLLPGSDKIRDNLIAYLNREQSFRIIPQTNGIIYAHGKFYKPNLPIYGNKKRFDLLKIFQPVKELAQINSEKGTTCSLEGWQKGSLFYLIDTLGKGTEIEKQLDDIDILVCDDLGREIADFIAASTKSQRVIFMHAKAFKNNRKTSAAAFHEICSQAIKNLEFLHPLSTQKPGNLKLWDDSWTNKIGTVDNRIRLGDSASKVVWANIRDIICNPSSSREVWLLLGSGFSLSAFETEYKKPNPAAETIQIIYLLQSTWSAASSVGANLRIFCSP